jgi:PAS domain S-box-containing protein
MKGEHKEGGNVSQPLKNPATWSERQQAPDCEFIQSPNVGILGDDRFSSIFHALDTPYQVVDRSGRIVQANRAWLNLLGYSVDQVIGRHFSDLIGSSGREATEEAGSRAGLEEIPWSSEVAITSGDGALLPVVPECLVRPDELVGFEYFHVILKPVPPETALGDIGARALNDRIVTGDRDRSLEHSIALLRLFFELAPIGVLISVAGEIAFADKTAADILEAEGPQQLVGIPMSRLVHSADHEKLRHRSRVLVKERRMALLSEYRWVRMDGETIQVEAASVPFTYQGKTAVQTVFMDVTRRKWAEQQIKTSLEEKEILLREIDHRVKNNLQVISSLLRLQSKYAGDRALNEVFEDCESRIRSMALVHEEVYRVQDLSSIDFHRCMEKVCRALFQAQGVNDFATGLQITSDGSRLGVDKAIPCALIVGELVSNALRRTRSGSVAGALSIDFRQIAGDRLQLTVFDEGANIPSAGDPEGTGAVDLQLVATLAKQLQAEVGLHATKGTEYRFIFER